MKQSLLPPIVCQRDLLEINCILKRGEKCHSYKIIRKRNFFTLVTKFPTKNEESTPIEEQRSGRQTASHQDKKKVSSEEKLPNRKQKHRKNKSSTHASNKQTDKKIKDSSDVKLGQPKFKKKPPSQVRRDRARRMRYWKRMKFARQLSAENLAEHYNRLETEMVASSQVRVVSQPENSGSLDRTSDVSQSYQLQEAETVASPQVTVVRQPEIYGCVDRISSVSQQYRYLTSERETFGIAQVQSDLNKLSAEAAVENSSSLLKDCEDSDIECARCLKRGSQT